MSKNQHRSNEQASANRNNQMSDDPAHGSGTSFIAGKDDTTSAENAPEGDRHDQSAIEAFGEEGAGVAAKE